MVGALGLLDGALKYGRTNWRATPVRASIYVDAARRHLAAWYEGEDADRDSGIPHLGHALACLAILVDADACHTLLDDRQFQGGYRKLLEKLTPHVKRLQALHEGKDPHHYTIADNAPVKASATRGVHFGTYDEQPAPPLAEIVDTAPLGSTIGLSLRADPTKYGSAWAYANDCQVAAASVAP